MKQHEDFLYPELTYKIREAIFVVWKELGQFSKKVFIKKP